MRALGPCDAFALEDDAFVLEDSDDYATVLSLAFRCFVRIDMRGSTHGTGGEHFGERNSAILLEDLSDGVGTRC